MKNQFYFCLFFLLPFQGLAQIFDPSNVTICKGGNATFQSGSIYPAPTYQWQMKHKGVWSDVVNTSPFSGAATRTLSITSVPDTLNSDSFKCKVYFNSNLVGTSKAACLTVLGGSVLPDSVFASVNPVSCPGASTQLSVNGGSLSAGSSWKWYAGSCGQYPVTNPVKPNANTTYYLRAEGPCGDTTACDTVTVRILNTQSSAPVTIISSYDSICAGDSTLLSLQGGSLGSGARWIWYTGNSCSVLLDSQGLSSIMVAPSATSQYSVRAEGICGASVCKFVTVFVQPLPLVDAGKDSSICLNQSIKLNPVFSGNKICLWSPSAGLNSHTLKSPIASPTQSTTYTLTIFDAYMCANSDSVRIVVHILPEAEAGKDTAICAGASVRLSASGGNFYNWTPGLGLNQTNIQDPIATPASTVKYKVRVRNLDLCEAEDSVTITVYELPDIQAGPDTAICAGEKVRLFAGGGGMYSWTPLNSLDSAGIASPLASPQASTTYRVEVGNGSGCKATDTVRINVKPLPVADAGADLALCFGESVQLGTPPGAGYTYTWKPAYRLSSVLIPNPVANPDTSTEYTVRVSANGCSREDTVQVMLRNGAAPVFTEGSPVVCKNTYASMYRISEPHHLLKWTVVNGSIITGQGSPLVFIHWSATASSGNVSVRDSLGSAPHCPEDVSMQVQIQGGPAAEPTVVKLKDNDINTKTVLCYRRNHVFFQWGLEDKTDRIESNTCAGDTLCTYTWGIDTLNYYYWVKVGSDMNCLSKSYLKHPGFPNALISHLALPGIEVYPQPAGEVLFVESAVEIHSAEIFNSYGQEVFSVIPQLFDHRYTIDLREVPAGLYFIRFNTGEGEVVKKVIRQ